MSEWQEEHERYMKQINDELKTLLIHFTIEDLKKRFFKNFGCINFKNDEFFHELDLARAFHKWHTERNPTMHDKHEETPYTCYHVIKCKCGFQEECDSSD